MAPGSENDICLYCFIKMEYQFCFLVDTKKSVYLKVDMLPLNPGDFKSSVCFSERLTPAYTQTLFKNTEKQKKKEKKENTDMPSLIPSCVPVHLFLAPRPSSCLLSLMPCTLSGRPGTSMAC